MRERLVSVVALAGMATFAWTGGACGGGPSSGDDDDTFDGATTPEGVDGDPTTPTVDGSTTPRADASGSCTTPETFGFFVMSLEAIQELSGSSEGFGGDLGGLTGADDKCQWAAESVGSCRTWHAFLSVTADENGDPVNAIDRIGEGPWYDINGHLLASDKSELIQQRPGSDVDIVWTDGWEQWPFNKCLTTERGNCNHSYGDTHDTLTGSNRQGQLYSTDMKYTCNDWTSTNVSVQLPIGHSWPRQLDGTNDGDSHWIYAHSNCAGGGGGGGPGGGGSTSCNGCGANINVTDTMEAGVGGDGGYGAWYCFAID